MESEILWESEITPSLAQLGTLQGGDLSSSLMLVQVKIPREQKLCQLIKNEEKGLLLAPLFQYQRGDVAGMHIRLRDMLTQKLKGY
jgi:hypothetical protein